MRRVEPDPDESRRKLWRAENGLTADARCSPPGLSRIASLIGKIDEAIMGATSLQLEVAAPRKAVDRHPIGTPPDSR